jgi:hypothetical protein
VSVKIHPFDVPTSLETLELVLAEFKDEKIPIFAMAAEIIRLRELLGREGQPSAASVLPDTLSSGPPQLREDQSGTSGTTT